MAEDPRTRTFLMRGATSDALFGVSPTRRRITAKMRTRKRFGMLCKNMHGIRLSDVDVKSSNAARKSGRFSVGGFNSMRRRWLFLLFLYACLYSTNARPDYAINVYRVQGACKMMNIQFMFGHKVKEGLPVCCESVCTAQPFRCPAFGCQFIPCRF